MDAQQRGAEATELVRHPVLRQALEATRAWALESFEAAGSPEAAWSARLRVMAVDEFVAYLMAVIQLGHAEANKVAREHEKMSERKRNKVSFEQHLQNASKARAEYNEKRAKVANG